MTHRSLLLLILLIHIVMLMWSAYRNAPTFNEPAHLVSGISHLQFHRFDLYRVNPPLIRSVAVIPLRGATYQTEWSRF